MIPVTLRPGLPLGRAVPLFFALFSLALAPLSAQVTAGFTATATSGCSPLTVQFFPQTTGPVTGYFWDFGNGNTSTLASPGVIYVNPGTYTVSLTVTDGTNTDVAVQAGFITVFADPQPAFSAQPSGGCAPLATTFTDLSLPGDAPIQSWLWDFGDGTVSTQANPSHLYPTAGSYDVTLVVVDSNGCSASLTQPDLVAVAQPPVVTFTWNAASTCQLPYTVDFASAVSPAGSYSYLWDFGDGGSATTADPSHTYTSPGTYSVSLVATTPGGCADTLSLPGAIDLQFPVAGFSATPTTVCAGTALSFTNSSTGGSQFFWDFGDGSVLSGPQASHVYSSPGTYSVRLVVENAAGCRDTLLRPGYVTVLPAPQAAFSSSPPTGCQVPFPVNFTANAPGAVAWAWDFGDGATATVANPSHVYTTPGFYDLTLVATGSNGCRDTLVQPAYVQLVPPVAEFVPSVTGGCIPLPVDFANLSSSLFDSITTYLWDFGDGNTSFQAQPTHTFTTVGQFPVQLVVVTQSGCRDTVQYPIEAGIPPQLAFDANPRVVCATDPVFFQNLSSPVNGVDWFWDFGDGGTSTAFAPVYTYGDTGYWDVTLVGTYFGCADTLVIPDFIRVLPPIAEFFLNPATGCEVPFTVALLDVSTGADHWFWSFGDGTVDSVQFPVHTYTALGTYTITLTVTNDSTGCADDFALDLEVAQPLAGFSLVDSQVCTGAAVTFVNQSTGATEYLWDFGDGQSSTATAPVHAYTSPGSYTVTLIARNAGGCADTLSLPALVEVIGPEAVFSSNVQTGCAPLPVTFANNSYALPASASIIGYQWLFGDGNGSTAFQPTHVYQQPGAYDVTLVVVDDQGCVDSLTRPAWVEPTFPTAAFTAVDTLVCPGAPVSFLNQSSGVGNTYLWEFGNGGTSTQANPFYVYPPNQGTYTVTLTATDVNGCVSTAQVIDFIAVGPPVAAFFAAPTQQACPPLTVSFTDQSSSNVTQWLWDFGDGSTSSLPNPAKVYNLPGQYDVTLIVNTVQGCSDTLLMPGLIDLSGPQGSFSFSPPAGCSPLAVTFTASTVGAVNWTWDFGDGSLGFGQTATHTYTQDTIAFPVLVIEDTAGCTLAIPASDSVVVQAGPVPGLTVSQPQACVGDLIQFSDASQSAVPVISYQWDFGDGSSAQGPNPQHSYAAPGTYAVQLTLTNVNGCTDSLSAPLLMQVSAPPQAAFTPSQLQGCAPLPVSFANTSLTSPASQWFWDFGDGSTATQAAPNHTFAAPGTYAVKLRVTNAAGCVDSVQQFVTVWPAPQAGFTVSATRGCAPLTVQFTDQSSAPASLQSWFWDFGDGSTATVPNPQHTYTFDGTFDVSLTITDVNGCVATRQVPDLMQLSRPVVSFTSNATASCPPQSVNFTAQVLADTTLAQWQWDFGDGSGSGQAQPSHLYTQSGTYTVTLVVTDVLGCSDTLTAPAHVTVHSPPVASFTASDSLFCVPATVAFASTSQAGSSPIVSYAWDFGNGGTATAMQPSMSFANPGSYAVRLVVTDFYGCADTASLSLTGHPGIQAAFGTAGTPDCAGSSITFLDQSSGAPAVAWSWDFGDGNTASSQFPSHTYPGPGSYPVSLAVESADGCRDTLLQPAFVQLSGPWADFTPDSLTACPGSLLFFADASIPDTTLVSWLWDFGDGATASGPNPSHAYSTPGTYTISLTVTNARGCSHTTVKPDAVTIVSPPQAAFTLSSPAGCLPLAVQFASTSQPGSTNLTGFQWDFGNGNTFAFPNASQVYTQPGTYSVQLVVTDALGCTDTATQNLTAYAGPQAAFTFSSGGGCAPQAIAFASQSSGPAPIVSWNWDFGDGNTASQPFPVHTYAANGSYAVQLTVTDANGCVDSLLLPQAIALADPQAAFTLSDSLLCLGETLSLTDASQADTSVVSWVWDFGDGQSGSGPAVSHSYASPGTYTLSLTITDARGCSASQPATVSVAVPPTATLALSDTAGCAPLSIQAAGSGPVGSQSWAWDFGDGTTASQAVVNHSFAQAGTYAVSLTVTDNLGCSGTATQAVTVYGVPTAAFLPPGGPACVGQPLSFQDLSTGPAPLATWLWDFGDGGLSSQAQPQHAYSDAGTYAVSLTVVDQFGCVDSVQLPAAVRVGAPVADFAVVNAPACPGTTVNFTDLSTSDTTLTGWAWIFGDGHAATGPQPSHSYPQPGLYDVTLVVTDVLGCRDTLLQPQAVEIYAPPQAAINAPAAGCVPLLLTAADASQGPVPMSQWVWTLDGQVNASGPQASLWLDSARTYVVGLTVTDQHGCTGSTSQPVVVHPLPVPAFTASDTLACAPAVTLFAGSASGTIVSWAWDLGDGSTASVQNPVHTYTADGSYDVQLTVTDVNGCVDSLRRPAYVELTRPDGDFTVDYRADCPPVEATFTAVGSSPYGIARFEWFFGDGMQALGNPVQHTYTDTGRYDLRLIITDSVGCERVIDRPAGVAIFGVEVPSPVQVHHVSVMGDAAVRLAWAPDPSPDFAAYLVYRQDPATGQWQALHETTARFDTLWVDQGALLPDTRNRSWCYKVITRNYCGTLGSLSAARAHCTVEVEAEAIPDRIVLTWNAYQGWDQVDRYEIYRVSSYNPATATFLDVVPGFVTAYLDSTTSCFNAYTYRVRAVGLEPLQQSWSDTTAATNQKSEPSVATDLVRATVVNDRQVLVAWEPFVMQDLIEVFLEKSPDGGQNWGTVATLPAGSLQYVDSAVDVFDTWYTYRLRGRDSCGFTSPYSNLGTSILLQAEAGEWRTDLVWTPYQGWENGVDYYEIQFYVAATGQWVRLDLVGGDLTSYVDRQTQLDQAEYCYRIVAHERGGRRAESLSNTACVPVQPELYIPNAFTPNDDAVNDRFLAQGVYIASFRMKIYNRWGLEVFHAEDIHTGWDGTHGGQPVPEGVYVYAVSAVTNTGRRLQREGTVTLIR